MFWTLPEILRSILDRSDMVESEILDEVIHGLDLFADTIEECDIELWHDQFEGDPWESATRSDIEESDGSVIASWRSNPATTWNSFCIFWIASFFAMTGTSLVDNTHPIE